MHQGRLVKHQLYEQFSRIGKAVASPQRLELLDLLCQGERSVEELAKEAKLAFANTSRHLQILQGVHLVDTRREGTRIYYRLADNKVCSFYRNMCGLAERRLSEVHQIMEDYFGSRKDLEAVNRQNLLARSRAGQVTILDVRPRLEYNSSHLPNAVSVPLRELKKYLDQLPKDQEIVAYCRGPYCVLAQEAVNLLRSEGFQANRLEDGVLEWQEAGLPVESVE
ncbi:metalloregulator ArsR/SmtB family transcription factor [bacterium]|nr:metalloregulator ArsR/SmtB family transcription factor [bacterium]